MFSTNNRSTEPNIPNFVLSFKLCHKEGTSSLFYADHDFNKDANTIFEALKNDTLFINYECRLIPKEREGRFYFEVEKGFDASNEGTQHYLTQAIENKIASLGLQNHFALIGGKFNSDEPLNASIILAHEPQSLKIRPNKNVYQEELDNLKFPTDSMPENYCCPITNSMMEIPACDIFYDHQKYFDYSVLLNLIRNNQPNPYTRRPLTNEQIQPDYVLWGKIQTFMDKARLIHKAGVRFENHMEAIQNETLSSHELAAQLNLPTTLDSTEDLIIQAQSSYKKYRFADALYLIELR